ncbi:MAG: glycosyltransferase family 2 protein [Candidatus Aenigmatarchaeota archaeon]
MSTAAVIPGYNEAETIEFIVEETKKFVDGVLYIDDGSRDGTSRIAEEAGAEVIDLKFNRGKGFALRTGFSIAIAKGYDNVIMLDSDGQHDPAYIPNFLNKLENNDMVIGSRYAGRFYTVPRNVLGNFGLNFITNMMSYGPQGLFAHRWLGDTQSGFRAIKSEALEKMNLKSDDYAIESEMIYEAAINNLKIEEIPIRIPVRVRGVTIKDGIKNALMVFKKRFKL